MHGNGHTTKAFSFDLEGGADSSLFFRAQGAVAELISADLESAYARKTSESTLRQSADLEHAKSSTTVVGFAPAA
jgi:hypothetical protein